MNKSHQARLPEFRSMPCVKSPALSLIKVISIDLSTFTTFEENRHATAVVETMRKMKEIISSCLAVEMVLSIHVPFFLRKFHRKGLDRSSGIPQLIYELIFEGLIFDERIKEPSYRR